MLCLKIIAEDIYTFRKKYKQAKNGGKYYWYFGTTKQFYLMALIINNCSLYLFIQSFSSVNTLTYRRGPIVLVLMVRPSFLLSLRFLSYFKTSVNIGTRSLRTVLFVNKHFSNAKAWCFNFLKQNLRTLLYLMLSHVSKVLLCVWICVEKYFCMIFWKQNQKPVNSECNLWKYLQTPPFGDFWRFLLLESKDRMCCCLTLIPASSVVTFRLNRGGKLNKPNTTLWALKTANSPMHSKTKAPCQITQALYQSLRLTWHSESLWSYKIHLSSLCGYRAM